MIYLICAQDSKKRIAEIDSKADAKTKFFDYVMSITNHRNVLYPYEFYLDVTKGILPNRVNVIFNIARKRKIAIVNGIVVNSVREILSTYSNNVDDIYIIASTRQMIEYFGNYADYLIIYETEDLGHTILYINDIINFANYNLLKTESFEDHKIHYLVVNPNNYLGN